MKKILFISILLSPFLSCVKAQIKVLGRTTVTATVPTALSDTMLIVFSGESNSGGIAANISATSAELLPRKLKILNNSTLIFDSLRIGINNLIGHYGLESYWYNSHGWELQIANAYDSNTFNGRNIFITKTGAGGSRIEHWSVGSAYYDTLQKRVDSALSILGGNPQIVLFYSQGINDIGSSTPVATWKAATKAHFQKIRAKYGNIKIVMTDFHINGSTWETYNITMAEIAAEEGNCYVINTTGASNDGSAHWLYLGMKQIATSMINIVK